MRSARLNSIQNTITKPNAAGSVHDGSGRYARLVTRVAKEERRPECRGAKCYQCAGRLDPGRASSNCRSDSAGVAFRMPQAERFRKLRDYLRAFEEPPLESQDFEEAAAMNNQCRSRGIAGSPIDFLICAVAHRRAWQIFTLDRDFTLYAKTLPVMLYTGS